MLKKLISGLVVFMLLFTISPSVKVLAKPDNFDNWAKAAINWGKATNGRTDYHKWCLRHVCACFRLRDSFAMVDNTGSGYYSAKVLEDALRNQNKVYDREFDGWKKAPAGSMLFFRNLDPDGHIVLYLGNGKILESFNGVRELEISNNYRDNYSGWAYPLETWRPSSDRIDKWANAGTNPSQTINVCSIERARYGIDNSWHDVAQKLRDKLHHGSFDLTYYNGLFGDPISGRQKVLQIRFNNGSSFEDREFKENTPLRFNKVSCGGGGGGTNCKLPYPQRTSPRDGDTVSRTNLVLRWNRVDGAKNYELKIYNHNKQLIVTRQAEGTDHGANEFVTENNTYYWSLASKCDDNSPGQESPLWRFFVKKDDTCISPTILSPRFNEVIELPFMFRIELTSSVDDVELEILDEHRNTVYRENRLAAFFVINANQLNDGKKYIARARVKCENGIWSAFSSEVPFSVKGTAQECKTPSVIKPRANTEIELPFDFAVENDRSVNITEYELEILNEHRNQVVYRDQRGHWMFILQPGSLEQGKRYFARARVKCENGIWSAFSSEVPFSVKANAPLHAPIQVFPENNRIFKPDITAFNAVAFIRAKYPDNEDRTLISFKFELEIVEENIFDSSDWLNSDLRSSNMQYWGSEKSIELWKYLRYQGPESVNLTFKWRVIARNDATMEQKSSDYWTFKIVYEPILPRGNSVGNIVNEGLVAQQADWIYFHNYEDEGKLYKIRTNGTEQTKLNEDRSFYINVIGEWVYYQNHSDRGRIYKIRTDGTGRYQLNDDWSSFINVVGEWIYYINSSKGQSIYKIRTDSTERTKLNDDWSSFINVVGEWIYYNNLQKQGFYKISTDGTRETKLCDDSPWHLNVVGEWVYYGNSNDNKLYKIRIDGTGRTKLNDDRTTNVNVSGDWIFYRNWSDGYKLYKIRTDGTGRTKLNDDNTTNINILGDWIYCNNNLYKIRKDGTGKSKVNNNPTIKIVKPVNGEDLRCGSNYNITWTSNNLNHDIYLWYRNINDERFTYIGKTNRNNNSFEWRIPSNLNGNYVILIGSGEVKNQTLYPDASNSVNFSISCPSSTPDIPQRFSPFDGEKDVALRPTFQWNSTPKASQYRVWLEQGGRIIWDQTTSGTSITYPRELSESTWYIWKIQAIGSTGTRGPESNGWSFRTIDRQSTPNRGRIQVKMPRDSLEGTIVTIYDDNEKEVWRGSNNSIQIFDSGCVLPCPGTYTVQPKNDNYVFIPETIIVQMSQRTCCDYIHLVEFKFKQKSLPEEPSNQPRGNSVGNIVNGGLVAQQGEWIYYQNTNDENKLYMVRTDGTGRTKLNDDSSWYINVLDHWIYYQNRSDGGKIYKIQTNGGGRTKLNDHWSEYINVSGGWIYYSRFGPDNIYKIRIDGTEQTKINDEHSWFLNVLGEWIYYYNVHSDSLYKIRTDGSDEIKISTGTIWSIIVIDDWVYYRNLSEDYKLYKIRTDGSGRTKLNEDNSSFFNVLGEWIYYSNGSDGGKLYKIRTNGSGRTKLNEDRSSYLNVLGEWIYYRNGSDNEKLYKIHSNGSGRQVVQSSPYLPSLPSLPEHSIKHHGRNFYENNNVIFHKEFHFYLNFYPYSYSRWKIYKNNFFATSFRRFVPNISSNKHYLAWF